MKKMLNENGIMDENGWSVNEKNTLMINLLWKVDEWNFWIINILRYTIVHVGACTSIFPKIGCICIRPIGDYDMAHMITWNNLQRNGS